MHNHKFVNLVMCTLTAVTIALTANLLAPFSPTYAEPRGEFQPPSVSHVLGTDNLGRDTFSRLLWGARASVAVASISTVTATLIGTALGIVAGVWGGRLDFLVSRILDIWLAYPGLLVALLFMSLWGRAGFLSGLVIGLSFAPIVARVIRSNARRLIVENFVTASIALGGNPWWIIYKHVARNMVSSLSALAATVFAWSMLSASGLEFLGLIGDSSSVSWGQMINEGRAFFREAPLTVIAPGLCIVIVVWGALMISSAISD